MVGFYFLFVIFDDVFDDVIFDDVFDVVFVRSR